MRKNNDDFLERILRDGNQQREQQDDVTIHVVKHKDKEIKVYEKRHDIQFTPDPEDNTRRIPQTVYRVTSQLGDDRMPLGKLPDNAGLCRFGCYTNIRSLLRCKYCRRTVCKEHSFNVGKRAYCRKGMCRFAGRTYQVFWIIYRVLRFCFCSVFGISITEDEKEHTADEDILESSQGEDNDIEIR